MADEIAMTDRREQLAEKLGVQFRGPRLYCPKLEDSIYVIGGIGGLLWDELERVTAAYEELAGELKQASDNAYCNYIDECRKPELCGAEFKLERGLFGMDDLAHHVEAAKLYGKHLGLHEALAALRRMVQPEGK